jgi:hypothetical protein
VDPVPDPLLFFCLLHFREQFSTFSDIEGVNDQHITEIIVD